MPLALIAQPKRIALCARSYLKKSYAPTTAWFVSPDAYVAEKQRYLEDIFHQIAVDYDEETANSLHIWCLRYVVDDDNATRLWIWGKLFRQLCGLVENAELSSALPLDRAALDCVCGIVHRYIQRDFVEEACLRIKAARSLHNSEWDEWLEERVRHAAGEGEILGAIEMALDLVENIIANHRTFQIWDELKCRISLSEYNHLVIWASRQASVLGIPDYAFRTPPF
ncbi:hypothetical protein ACE1CI_05200 [Aerosakkonemataceae cyanobacterium BLCC-F50]|uniref:Uncharacterized protein n=1 Tax=Floridaenema flaviceps BLCC-F50 TaxID=3153642 RepID=A0ABV4XL77_9CYAN